MRFSRVLKFSKTSQVAMLPAGNGEGLFDDKTLESDPIGQSGDTIALSELGYSSSDDVTSPVAARGDMLVW